MTADTIGGVWTFALELTRALKPHGVQVALATLGRRLDHAQHDQAKACSNLTLFESEYKLEWMPEPWEDVAAAGEWLLSLERELSPELLHLNGYAHAQLGWSCPKLVVGHSCVCSWWEAVHGEQAPEEWNRYRQEVTSGLQSADLVTAPTKWMLEALQRHYGPLPRTLVIPNGRLCAKAKKVEKEAIILSAGRLWDAGKNVRLLHTSAKDLPWPVYIAGEIQNDCFWGDNIRVLGKLSETELWDWYARASIYASPARYEPFGLSILEAAMAECALVLGDIPSLREVWGNAALFVDPADPQALAAALKNLSASSRDRAELAQRARARAQRYTTEAMALRYLRVYGDLLAGCHTRKGEMVL